VGGTFYTGTLYPPAWQNRYYLADWDNGWIRAVQMDANNNVLGWATFVTNALGPVTVRAEPGTGNLYFISLFTDQVLRVRYTGAVGVDPAAAPRRDLAVRSHPNPFRESTRIEFDLPVAAEATLAVYDVGGRVVRTLAAGAFAAGSHAFEWDGRDDHGNPPAAGVYFAQLTSGRRQVAVKVVPLN
jgi:hypothetical protein